MTYQASFFRDGQWVTETVDLATALKGSSSSTKQTDPVIEHPACGILSSTIVDSPIVHKILPVRLRSRHHNDIALIGEHVVTIRELRDNGQTHEVLKYRNLGSRIRNAVVLGTCPDDDAVDDDSSPGGIDRVGDLEAACHPSTAGSSRHAYPPIPPQILVLILGTGEMVFLFIRDVNGAPEFCITKHAPSVEVPYLGCHFAVDPTSRFMAAAAFEEILAVYELEPRATLDERYMTTGSLGNPFKSIRYRSLRGTVYDVQFLHPRPQDDYHIILMVILSSKGRDPNQQATRRYVIWDWAVGNDLRDVLNKAGHRQALAVSAGVPLFTIPLKSQSAFFIVYPRQIALVKQPMSVADYDSSFLDGPEHSDLFHGKDAPLWTAWARPFRLKQYYEKTDVIYLAREDGFMFHIEIDSSTLLFSRMELGSVGTIIGTAFTTAYDRFSDVFIIGGDSAPGGIWKLAPRSELERVSTFANWSPVVDSTVIIDNSPCGVAEPAVRNGSESRPQMKRDRIFFASGRGASGCLVELRVGLKARIGTAVDVEQPIKQAWLFANRRLDDGSMYAILAHPHWTTILAFSAGFADVRDETTETSPFDTTSRTLHAIQTPTGMIVQASETSVSLIAATQNSRHSFKDLIQVDDQAEGIVADNAFCSDDFIVITVQHAGETRLHMLRIEEMGVTPSNSWTIAGEISCICQLKFFGKTHVAVGSVVEGPLLSVYSPDGRLVTAQRLESAPDGSAILEALTSICVVREADGHVEVMAGTRCGQLLTIRISDDSHDPISWRAERLGTASANVFPSLGLFNKGASALATCDNGLVWLSGLDVGRERPGRRDIIWPTDVSDAALPAPPVHSAFMIGPTTEGAGGEDLLLLVSGTSLLVVDVESRAGPVPRSLPLGCTVTRMMFSNIWRCLVVAVQEEKGVGLRLIDPDTGTQISKPLDGEKREGYLTSFGHAGDKILGIHEWKYVKDNQTFPFIIVTMLSGKLVIVSVSHIRQPDTTSPRRRLEHWTRYRKKGLDGPVYSVVADEEGIIYCAGKTLHREVLDLAERKLKPVKTHDLESPATSLEIVDGRLYALTTSHSVQVLDYKSNPGSRDMAVLHSDRVSRATVHMTTVHHTKGQDGWAVTLLSDLAGGVTGVYVPEGQGNKDLGAIFRADLINPVRRFIRTHSRSIRMAKEGRVPRLVSASSTKDGLEVLGVSVDGTLRQFKLLGMELWRYLDLVQRLARNNMVTAAAGTGGLERTADAGSGEVIIDDDIAGGEELDPVAEPKNMYIDGDILGFCLEQRLLERIVGEGDCAALFCRCLDRLEGGVYTSGFAGSGASGNKLESKYFELGYEILEKILAPVA